MEFQIVGIDISKETFDVCFLSNAKAVHSSFENTRAGFKKLKQWFRKIGGRQAHCCMEATGRYWEELALFLHDDGQLVSVVNPSTVSAFRKTELIRSKTDKADAALIARYCLAVHPKPWEPPSAEQLTLQHLVRQLESLKDFRKQERTRLASGLSDGIVTKVVQEHVLFLSRQINDLKKVIRAHIRSHPQMKRNWDLLATIKGVGEALAFIFLAEVGSVDRFSDVRKLIAFAGLDVREFRSGTSIHKRPKISKAGNARLRKALYLPAVSAMRFNPVIRVFVARLKERGVHGMIIVCGVMRKLLHTIYGVLKTQTEFNPSVQLKMLPQT